MSEPVETRIVRKYREYLGRDELTGDIRITYRVTGGMPHQRLDREFSLSGTGEAAVKVRDELKPIPLQEASRTLDRAETRDLLREIDTSLDSLVPRSEARFLPDSLVGMITLEVGGEEATLFFLADQEQRLSREVEGLADDKKHLAQERLAESPLTRTMQRIGAVSQRLLESEGAGR